MSPRKPAAPKKTAAKAAKPAKTGAKSAAKPRAAAKKKAPAASAVQVFIDYPQAGEVVRPGHYTLRLGSSPAAALLEVSIDGGEWLACRESGGYWWYDWSGYSTGPHGLQARARTPEGQEGVSEERRFRVSVEAEEAAGGPAPSTNGRDEVYEDTQEE